MKLHIQSLLLFILLSGTSLMGNPGKHINHEIESGAHREPALKTSNQSDQEIIYSIEPFYDIDAFRLIVVLQFKGDKSGETKLVLPNNYGSDEDIKGIKFLKSLSENTTIENTDKPEIKLVKHSPNAILKIYYQIQQVRKGEPELGNHYMATINKQYFNVLGETFFITPNWNMNDEFTFKVFWNKLPKNWTLANSFGVNSKSQEIKTQLWKFRHSVFVGGDFRIVKRNIYNNPVYIAIKGKWNFSDEQFSDLVQTILREERDFWNDFNFPYYLITLFPIEGSNDQGGTGRVNSYALFLSSDRQIDYRMKRLLAHETFHTWLGEKVNLSEPEALLYWFSEGFSDYYARLLLFRAGLISFEEYVSEYNKVVAQYFKSPVRNETNERIATDFWNDSEINKLPYQRGDIIAHNLNASIIKASNGQKSLDNLMRELLKLSSTESMVTSTGSLTALIRFYGGEQILADIMKALNSGAQLKTYQDALGPCMSMEMESSRKFWLIGEKYYIPVYKAINEDQIIGKDCFDWFGVK